MKRLSKSEISKLQSFNINNIEDKLVLARHFSGETREFINSTVLFSASIIFFDFIYYNI